MENPCSISLDVEVIPGQEEKKRSGKKRPIILLSPGQEEKKRSSTKRPIILLSPATLPAKRMKTSMSPSEDNLKKPQAGLSTTTDTPAEAVAVQATIATSHEMVLRNTSTTELLRLLGEFLCQRCHLIKDLSWDEPVTWLRNLDRFFYKARWQPHRFIAQGSLVFIYMLCRDTISAEITSKEELKAVLLGCFYVSIAYIGSEVSYPARLFIVDGNRMAFWNRTLEVAECMSEKMLQLHTNMQYFSEVFADLKNRKDH